ncbi:flavin reductase family protein [Nocardioides sp. IC4_145]|uniref:flavin reductase family protein n=1 Tax=Nocardioides sp. IC4_145 TaxID=2714037 RepID=UPI00140DE445|nr:flavin reductase family protein [Nocardioides sp. IC4_145]NHC24325.1 flavin reductase family protein [Nocardioides sp. IC4_145]
MTTPSLEIEPMTAERVKGFHRTFVTGVTAVTTRDGATEEPRGLVVNAFSALSLDPPSIVVCVQKTSTSYRHLFARDHLAVNILAADQAEVASQLASKAPDKFTHIRWRPAPAGSPVLDGAAAWLEARITERIQSSTHTMFIAEVTAVDHSDRAPLLYASGRFYDGGHLTELGEKD